jgi:CRP/FNR family transcriptional regulator, nitrogen oxide reductase regulator
VTPVTPALLAKIPLFLRVSPEDRQRIAEVAQLRTYERGDRVFDEDDPSDFFFIVVSGRIKVFKRAPGGNDIILELFGPGGPLGAVAAYEARPYPASAAAMEPSECVVIRRDTFFQLLEQHPTLVRGLLGSLSLRLVQLTTRLAELTGGRVEARFARLFLKLAEQLGRPRQDGVLIPLPLSRQELADWTGTTIETSIRIMSRWGKEDVLKTEKDGFVLIDRATLEAVAES